VTHCSSVIVAVPDTRLLQFAKICSNLAKYGSSAASLAAVGLSIITPEVDDVDGGVAPDVVGGLEVIGGAVCAGCCCGYGGDDCTGVNSGYASGDILGFAGSVTFALGSTTIKRRANSLRRLYFVI
jgi:hypothetical protein